MKLVIEAVALKILPRMPKDDAAGLRAKLKAFAAALYEAHPWAKAFGGGRGRIRHGDWRAVYYIDGGALVVTVLKVGNRKEVYRRTRCRSPPSPRRRTASRCAGRTLRPWPSWWPTRRT